MPGRSRSSTIHQKNRVHDPTVFKVLNNVLNHGEGEDFETNGANAPKMVVHLHHFDILPAEFRLYDIANYLNPLTPFFKNDAGIIVELKIAF